MSPNEMMPALPTISRNSADVGTGAISFQVTFIFAVCKGWWVVVVVAETQTEIWSLLEI